jgi:hypothetical protein
MFEADFVAEFTQFGVAETFFFASRRVSASLTRPSAVCCPYF